MAQNERSFAVVGMHQKSAEAFNYFVCGVAGAIFAYIVKDYSPQKLAPDVSLLTPIALLLLAFSFFAGLLCIESTNQCTKLDALKIASAENAEHLTKLLDTPGTPFNSQTGVLKTRESLEQERDLYLTNVLACSP